MSLGACFGRWGAEQKALLPAPGAHLFPAPPLRGGLRFPRKTLRPGNRWGRSDRSPSRLPPPRTPPRPPNPPEGAVADGGTPSYRLPPTPAGSSIYNSAPILGLSAGARCRAALIAAGISAPPRAGGGKFSFRKLWGTFSKTPRPKDKTNPSAHKPLAYQTCQQVAQVS